MRSYLIHTALALVMISAPAAADALDELVLMSHFFTDSSMKTMKPKAEFAAAWKATSRHDQQRMMRECNDAAMSKPHAAFCAELFALRGQN